MSKKFNPADLKLRLIKRQQVQQLLAITASFAVLMSGCVGNNGQVKRRSTNTSSTATNTNIEPEEAVFYETAEQCRLDVNKQNEEYQVLLQAHETGKLSAPPVAPKMQAENCDAQIQAAREAHQKDAPMYKSSSECENAGYRCESTSVGYRPAFGGAYYYNRPDYVYIYRGGNRHRVYRPRTVYYSRDSDRVVTPSGRSFSRSRTGKVVIPRSNTGSTSKNKTNRRSTTRTTPSSRKTHTRSKTRTTRPKSKPARGAVKGRGSKGFGSTYKSTGRGGK